MAKQQGKKLDEATRRAIIRAAQVNSIRETARVMECSRNTVRKVLRKEKPAP